MQSQQILLDLRGHGHAPYYLFKNNDPKPGRIAAVRRRIELA
jgi:hypothetical protein